MMRRTLLLWATAVVLSCVTVGAQQPGNGNAASNKPSPPPLTPIGPDAKVMDPQPQFDRTEFTYNSFVFWKYGFAGWFLCGVFGLWGILYVSCRMCACDDCSTSCLKMVEFLCCTGYAREGYTSAAVFVPKLLIVAMLFGLCAGGMAASGANVIFHKNSKSFLMDYDDEITALEKEIKFISTHLEIPEFSQAMQPIVVKARETQASYSTEAVTRNVVMLCGIGLSLLALSFGLFAATCMAPSAAIAMILLSFLATSVLWFDFGLHNMDQRYNEDLCLETYRYSMNKTGSIGLRSYFSCPSNTSMLAPFNQSFYLLKSKINKLNADQKSRRILDGKDMASKDVFDAIPTPPKPKQGVFVTALKVVVDEDINALRAGVTDALDSKNISKSVSDNILAQMDELATFSRIMVLTSQYSRCLYANKFFEIIDKNLCQAPTRTSLKTLVSYCFWVAIAMMAAIALGISGERRFDPMNHMSARSAESGRDENVTAPMLAAVELDQDEPTVPEEDTV